MRFSVRKRRQPPAVIIVSLIDIMIVLLIFLMVTTTFKHAPALRITLPQANRAATKSGVSLKPPIIVTITTNQPYFYLDRLPVTVDTLRSELVARVKKDPDAILAVRADADAAYKNVVTVTEAATLAHVKQIEAYIQPAIRP